jgi:hypothetical protein
VYIFGTAPYFKTGLTLFPPGKNQQMLWNMKLRYRTGQTYRFKTDMAV